MCWLRTFEKNASLGGLKGVKIGRMTKITGPWTSIDYEEFKKIGLVGIQKTFGRTHGRLDMIWLLHKVLTWFQAWKSHVAGWLLQRRLYPLFQCCGVDLLDIHLHTARARVTIIKFLIPLVFPIQFQPLPDEETVDRSHYIIKYCNLHQTRILEYK